jgi:hypothetical protein
MNFPDWATGNAVDRLRFLCLYLASYAGADGVASLARVSKLNRQTIYNGINRGQFSPVAAKQLTACVPSARVPAHWLTFPEGIVIIDGVADVQG